MYSGACSDPFANPGLSHVALHDSAAVLSTQNGEVGKADVFYFDYGVLVFWGLTEKQERDVIRNIAMPCLLDPLPQVRQRVTRSLAGSTTAVLPPMQRGRAHPRLLPPCFACWEVFHHMHAQLAHSTGQLIQWGGAAVWALL